MDIDTSRLDELCGELSAAWAERDALAARVKALEAALAHFSCLPRERKHDNCAGCYIARAALAPPKPGEP